MIKLICPECYSDKVIFVSSESMIDKRKYNIDTVDCNADLQKIVTNIDTAFDVDKVVEQ